MLRYVRLSILIQNHTFGQWSLRVIVCCLRGRTSRSSGEILAEHARSAFELAIGLPWWYFGHCDGSFVLFMGVKLGVLSSVSVSGLISNRLRRTAEARQEQWRALGAVAGQQGRIVVKIDQRHKLDSY